LMDKLIQTNGMPLSVTDRLDAFVTGVRVALTFVGGMVTMDRTDPDKAK
jgi:hypothetical protein